MNRKRCEWCGRLVANDTPITRRRTKGADGKWRRFEQQLCPGCRASVQETTRTNRPLPDGPPRTGGETDGG